MKERMQCLELREFGNLWETQYIVEWVNIGVLYPRRKGKENNIGKKRTLDRNWYRNAYQEHLNTYIQSCNYLCC